MKDICVVSLFLVFCNVTMMYFSCVFSHWLCRLLSEYCQLRNSFPLILEHLLYLSICFHFFSYNSFIGIVHLTMIWVFFLHCVRYVVLFCSELPRHDPRPDDSGSATLNSLLYWKATSKSMAWYLECMLLNHTHPHLLIKILVTPWNLCVTLDKLLP